jgi:hypothetical protein
MCVRVRVCVCRVAAARAPPQALKATPPALPPPPPPPPPRGAPPRARTLYTDCPMLVMMERVYSALPHSPCRPLTSALAAAPPDTTDTKIQFW